MKKISTEFLKKINEVHFLASNAFTSIPKELYLDKKDNIDSISNIHDEKNNLDERIDLYHDDDIKNSEANNSKKLLN